MYQGGGGSFPPGRGIARAARSGSPSSLTLSFLRARQIHSAPVADPPARIARYLEEIGAQADRRSGREWAVQVPCQKRGAIAAIVAAGEHTATLQAFYCRAPDRGHEAVYRRLLRKNLGTYSWRFALDDDGDIFLAAQVPLACLSTTELDDLLGTLAVIVDETWEGVLRSGFEVPEGTVFAPPPGEPANG